MASTDAIIARTTNKGSQLGTAGTQPRLATIQKPKKGQVQVDEPHAAGEAVIASASRS